jgi:hypothetical protein
LRTFEKKNAEENPVARKCGGENAGRNGSNNASHLSTDGLKLNGAAGMHDYFFMTMCQTRIKL